MDIINRPVLVTGGTGFIGSHVTEALLRAGYTVVVPYVSLDQRSYFMTQKFNTKTILVPMNIQNEQEVLRTVTSYHTAYIIHLAAQPIVETAYEYPSETIRTNILGTLNILEAARRFPFVRHVLVASSDKAYGKSDNPYKENDGLRGDHPYEASKSSADLLAQAYIKTYGLPVSIARMGNVYGPGDLHFDRIIPGIITSRITGETLVIRSDGTFIRQYIYVKDVVSAFLTILGKTKKSTGEVYNISTQDTYSVLELLSLSQKVFKKNIVYTIAKTEKNEIPSQMLDTKKIRTLGWKPDYSLQMGLDKTYQWYKKHKELLFGNIPIAV